MYLEKPGEVITFYSYAGGVGRSMALANIGCLLARRCGQGRGVLMVDWNLDAPGLHGYFQDGLLKRFPASPDPARCVREQPGLIDLFSALDRVVGRAQQQESSADEVFEDIDLAQYELDTGIPSLHLLKAGRFDGDYSYLASSFDWAGLHNRAPWLIGALMGGISLMIRGLHREATMSAYRWRGMVAAYEAQQVSKTIVQKLDAIVIEYLQREVRHGGRSKRSKAE